MVFWRSVRGLRLMLGLEVGCGGAERVLDVFCGVLRDRGDGDD
jgi:hypothetical protein